MNEEILGSGYQIGTIEFVWGGGGGRGGCGDYDSVEVDHPTIRETLCACIERLQRCPDGRWMFSVDVLDFVNNEGQPPMMGPRSIAAGIVFTREQAVAGVETAIRRIIGGIGAI